MKRTWIQNLLNRYRVVIINQITFEERFFFRISQFNIIILFSLFVTAIAIGSFFLVAYTPIKEFIPGYTSIKIRKEAVKNSFLLDSLTIEFQKQNRFIESIKRALTGEIKISERDITDTQGQSLEVLNSANSITKADSLLSCLLYTSDAADE